MLYRNNQSDLDNLYFVEESIEKILLSKRIIETPFVPHVVSPLTFSKK
jgi:hypothetical protein